MKAEVSANMQGRGKEGRGEDERRRVEKKFKNFCCQDNNHNNQ